MNKKGNLLSCLAMWDLGPLCDSRIFLISNRLASFGYSEFCNEKYKIFDTAFCGFVYRFATVDNLNNYNEDNEPPSCYCVFDDSKWCFKKFPNKKRQIKNWSKFQEKMYEEVPKTNYDAPITTTTTTTIYQQHKNNTTMGKLIEKFEYSSHRCDIALRIKVDNLIEKLGNLENLFQMFVNIYWLNRCKEQSRQINITTKPQKDDDEGNDIIISPLKSTREMSNNNNNEPIKLKFGIEMRDKDEKDFLLEARDNFIDVDQEQERACLVRETLTNRVIKLKRLIRPQHESTSQPQFQEQKRYKRESSATNLLNIVEMSNDYNYLYQTDVSFPYVQLEMQTHVDNSESGLSDDDLTITTPLHSENERLSADAFKDFSLNDFAGMGRESVKYGQDYYTFRNTSYACDTCGTQINGTAFLNSDEYDVEEKKEENGLFLLSLNVKNDSRECGEMAFKNLKLFLREGHCASNVIEGIITFLISEKQNKQPKSDFRLLDFLLKNIMLSFLNFWWYPCQKLLKLLGETNYILIVFDIVLYMELVSVKELILYGINNNEYLKLINIIIDAKKRNDDDHCLLFKNSNVLFHLQLVKNFMKNILIPLINKKTFDFHMDVITDKIFKKNSKSPLLSLTTFEHYMELVTSLKNEQ